MVIFFFFKHKTAYEMRISDWSSDVCSSDLFASSTHLLTHEVTNQPGPFAGYNLYLTDNALREAAQRDGGGWIEAPLRALGEAVGTEEEVGRSSWRERVCQYVWFPVVAVQLKKK